MMSLLTILVAMSLAHTKAEFYVEECEAPALPPAEFTNIQLDSKLGNVITSQQIRGVTNVINNNRTVRGLLIEPSDEFGCQDDSYNSTLTLTEPWIALIARGVCTFEFKGLLAQHFGAVGIIVYSHDNSTRIMNNVHSNLSAAMIENHIGIHYFELLYNGTKVYATMSRAPQTAAITESGSRQNSILLVLTSIMSPTALLLNLVSLIAIVFYPEKPKPYLYLITNLVITDLIVAIIGTTMILLLYPSFTDEPENKYTKVVRPCIGELLQDLWDVAMYSNLFTLFNLTIEHFIAFRWPLKHKIMVTKKRVVILIGFTWLVSFIPMITALIEDFTTQVPECWQELGYCYKKYYLRNESYFYNWIHSLVWILVVAAIFLVMVFVYGYIIWIIYRVSLRNPGFRKKRSAVVTTMCLVISFVLSYIFYFIVHFYISVNQDKKTELYLHASQSFQKICPACNLMLDFLLTGMVGAIMDPIIYCARMKEIKLALNQICRTHGFSRQRSMSSTGYVRAVVHSTHSTVEHEMTEEPF